MGHGASKESNIKSGVEEGNHHHILSDDICLSLFKKYDINKNKSLSREELKELLTKEFGLSDEKVKLAGSLMDVDTSGAISWPECQAILKQDNLCRILCDTRSCKFLSEAWKVFRKYDMDQNASLSQEELQDLLAAFGIPKTRCASILSQADADGNLLLGFNEFVHWLPATAALLQINE